MIRVYDKKEERWMHGDFCILSNGDLAELKKRPFGTEKIELLSNERYIWHEDIKLYDSIGNLIFEGDICRLDVPDNESLYCFVAYIPERAAYLLFDEKNLNYYNIDENIRNIMSVVGNVIDNQDILNSYVGLTEEEE